jgi:hypothetical protein
MKETEIKNMREVILLVVSLTIGGSSFASAQAQSQSDKINSLILKNDNPAMLTTIPIKPLDAYQAYCSTTPGLCVVQGDGVIPAGTDCHCGDYAGKTW